MGQQLVNGLFAGSIYALFAVGYALVFGVLDILNLAHEAVFMIGAFAALELVLVWHAGFWVALLGAIAIAGLAGVVVEFLAFRPLRRRADAYFSGLVSSLALASMFEAVVLQAYGPNLKRFPPAIFPRSVLRFGAVQVSWLQLTIVLVSLLLTAALQVVLRRSSVGRAIRAVAENETAARVLGIDVNRIILLTFVVSSALGGVAGMLFGVAYNGIDPTVGHSVELKGLAVIILGGMGSVPGAVLGGYLLGLTEVLTVVVFGSPLRDAAAFVVLFLVLLVRPRGLLGRRSVREA